MEQEGWNQNKEEIPGSGWNVWLYSDLFLALKGEHLLAALSSQQRRRPYFCTSTAFPTAGKIIKEKCTHAKQNTSVSSQHKNRGNFSVYLLISFINESTIQIWSDKDLHSWKVQLKCLTLWTVHVLVIDTDSDTVKDIESSMFQNVLSIKSLVCVSVL